MCARRKQSVIFKIDRTMNYFLLAETDFFRLINEAGDCNMETAYTAFATQVIELCNGGMDMNLYRHRALCTSTRHLIMAIWETLI